MGWRDWFGGKAESTADLIAANESARPVTPADVDARIRALINAGKKIEAIKEYRSAYGTGLAEAKDAIDAIASGQAPPTPASARRPADATDDADILALLSAGKKIEAIKLYRQRYDTGLAEAKDAIDAVARGNGTA